MLHVKAEIVTQDREQFVAETDLGLISGTVPGAESCLAPGQSFSLVKVGLTGGYVALDDLPEAITHVKPVLPRDHGRPAAPIMVILSVIVCTDGHVIYERRVNPVTADPSSLEEQRLATAAAVAAVKQWVFRPGMVNGQPRAVEVVVPMKVEP